MEVSACVVCVRLLWHRIFLLPAFVLCSHILAYAVFCRLDQQRGQQNNSHTQSRFPCDPSYS